MNTPTRSLPWYRVPMAWLALLLPLSVVLAGVYTLRLAAQDGGDADPDLVRRQAQMQTRATDEDLVAARLGLAAELRLAEDGQTLSLAAKRISVLPELTLHWVHATRASLDRQSSLRWAGPGQWQGELPAGLHGRYGLRLTPPDRRWRLLGRYDGRSELVPLAPAYAAAPAGHEP
ncbi:MAG: FixH family protein [Lysobacterales bacterium]